MAKQKQKHSKYKNSGLIFELLIRRLTSDVLSGNDSAAVNIIKKYYSNTELAKEHKLYQMLMSSKLNESKAESLLNSVLDLSKKLNKNYLKRDKFNLIKEIKENYNIEEFFKTKINNYPEYASIYNLMEIYAQPDYSDPTQLLENKNTLLEFISKAIVEKPKDDVFEEYSKFDKGTRILTYKILIDKFNSKYSSLIPEQKLILKEYINSVANNPKLKDFINAQLLNVKAEIKLLTSKVEDQTIKIKLNEVQKMLIPIDKATNVKDSDVLNLLQYYSLITELKQVK